MNVRLFLWIPLCLFIFVLSIQAFPSPVCWDCHEDDGHKAELDASVHKGLQCENCHNYISSHLEDHPENFKPTQKADCYLCHKNIANEHKNSIHGIALQEGIDESAKCWDCHGSHRILSGKNPNSKVNINQMASTCGKCHDNPELMQKFNVAVPQPGTRYAHSVHGPLLQQGNILIYFQAVLLA